MQLFKGCFYSVNKFKIDEHLGERKKMCHACSTKSISRSSYLENRIARPSSNNLNYQWPSRDFVYPYHVGRSKKYKVSERHRPQDEKISGNCRSLQFFNEDKRKGRANLPDARETFESKGWHTIRHIGWARTLSGQLPTWRGGENRRGRWHTPLDFGRALTTSARL